MKKLGGLRRRLTYANVIATLALFFALTGGAMAGVKYITASDTIPATSDLAGSTYGNPQIAAGKVTSGKVADGAVSNVKLQNSSLSVNPGTGLTGGGSVALGGSTSLGVANGGIGTNQLADGSVTNAKLANPSLSITAGTGLTGGGSISLGGSSSLSVDPTAVQSRVTGTCASGSAIASINQNGTVACRQPGDSVVITSEDVTVAAGKALTTPVSCPDSSYTAISGGVYGPGTNTWQPLSSFPLLNVWYEGMANLSGSDISFTLYAVCLPHG
jgi:hypothetical protein